MQPIPVVCRFKARIVIFNVALPLTKGSPVQYCAAIQWYLVTHMKSNYTHRPFLQVIYHSQSLNEPANLTRLISQLHKSTGEVLKRKPRLASVSIQSLSLSPSLPLQIGRASCRERV